jgi:hypothetical protein
MILTRSLRFWWLILPGFVACLILFRQVVPSVQPVVPLLPGVHIDCPINLELGELSAGEAAVARFAITNLGNQILTIDGVRSSCSCGTLERVIEQNFLSIQTLDIPPGESVPCAVRTVAKGIGSGVYGHTIRFRTNDADHPEFTVNIRYRVLSTGITLSPPQLVFGHIGVGTAEERTIEVRDGNLIPSRISSVTVDHPDRITANLEPTGIEPDLNELGKLIGLIRISANTKCNGPLATVIRVNFSDNKLVPQEIIVSGEVVPFVQVIPNQITLPRSTGNGPVYSADCRIHSIAPEMPVFTIESCPVGLKAELITDSEGLVKYLRITSDIRTSFRKEVIRLTANALNKTETLEVAVSTREE